MPGWIRRLSFLLLLCTALLTAGAGSAEEPPYSRSHWKKSMKGIALFSGEIDPEVPLPPEAFSAPALAPRKGGGRPAWVRVSRDILAPDSGSRGQAETQTEPFLAIDPKKDANLLAGYQEGRFENGGARVLTFAVSKNSGRTWTEGIVPGLTRVDGGAFQRASDPWVAYGIDGRAYYASLLFNETDPDNGIFVSASADGGKTWGPPVEVHRGGANEFDDKQALVVDTRSDSPFRGRVYVGWDTVLNDGNAVLRVSWSGDGGQSYSPSAILHRTGANLGIIPLVGPGGVLHAVWFHGDNARGPYSILSARSEDGGATWSQPVRVAAVAGAGVPNLRTGGIPAAAIDPRTGRLYVVWPDDVFTQGVDQILMTVSDDGGQTWSAARVVSDGPADAPSFTPAVAVGPTGRVAISYYSLRNDPDRLFLVDHYIALSANGESFAAARRSTKAPFDARFAAFASGAFFLGDYQGLVVGKKLVHGLWIGTVEASKIDPPARQSDAFVISIR